MSDDLHIIPDNDLREHEADRGCFCNPKMDPNCPNVFIHNSLDRREFYEENPELIIN